jgi:transaldolase
MSDALRRLDEEGVAVWLDDVSRDRLRSGSLEGLIRDHGVSGVTTNPTIFEKAIAGSTAYAAHLCELATLAVPVEQAVRLLTTYDVRAACDLLRPVYEQTGGIDGRVSIEVDPRLAADAERTQAEARLLWWLVDRPNVMVKIPATADGLAAISACLAEGISVNATLIFSLDRYSAVMEAYLSGLEQALDSGLDVSRITSVASFFLSRVDAAVDPQLDAVGTDAAARLRGKTAIANARLAYQRFEEVLSSQRWQSLAAAGAHPQRPLWASTGVKDPAYDPTRYVVDLVGPGVVNTMPEPTLLEVASAGLVRGDTIRPAYADARRVLDELAAVGIDYDSVVAGLERDGVEKFQLSWTDLLASVSTAMTTHQAAPPAAHPQPNDERDLR